MNDEDFARNAFAAAFRSGSTGEPPTLPDVELLALHGRRANRNRHGAYVAGTTALAGVVVAGVVTGPALLGLGSPSPSGISVGAAGATGTAKSPAPSSSSSAPDPAKPSPGVPCATPPAIDWARVLSAALPAGVTATADHSANCVQTPDGSRSIDALFKLSTGGVELQVNVGTGPDIAAKLGAGPATFGIGIGAASGSLDPGTLGKIQAMKLAAGGGSKSAPDIGISPSPSLDAAALASLQAQKRAQAGTAASDSPAPGASGVAGIKAAAVGSCSKVGPDENACVSHLTKGSLSVVDAEILRTGASPLVVDVAATSGKDDLATPDPGQLPSDATMLAIAQAVAAHF
jgi:hypothetical protein